MRLELVPEMGYKLLPKRKKKGERRRMRVGRGDGVKEERTCRTESGILTVKTEHKSIAFERRERHTHT